LKCKYILTKLEFNFIKNKNSNILPIVGCSLLADKSAEDSFNYAIMNINKQTKTIVCIKFANK